MLEPGFLCLYPFLSAASGYVNKAGLTLEDLISSASARMRAKERVIEAIRTGIIVRPVITHDAQAQMELLSYPFARILVSCIHDSYLIRRYALAEAKGAHKRLLEDLSATAGGMSSGAGAGAGVGTGTGTGRVLIHELAEDLGIHAEFLPHRSGVRVHFTDYLRLSVNLRDRRWKLVNRSMVRGKVRLEMGEFVRIIQEAMYERIVKDLPLDVPAEICDSLKEHIEHIKNELALRRNKHEELRGPSGGDTGAFPPCMIHILNNLREGVNVPHSARFAVTAFLLNAGLSVDEVIELYRNSPDFDEARTRYQVEHIAGTKSGTRYTAPSCATMRTYGNCVGKDELCEKISHPLSYYRLKIRSKLKQGEKK